MFRRVSAKAVSALPLVAGARAYNTFVFKNADRRPQMTPEERSKVVIDQSQWPEEFRDYDPEDPYKNSPAVIELSSWSLFLWGVECAFIYQLYELVFPKSI